MVITDQAEAEQMIHLLERNLKSAHERRDAQGAEIDDLRRALHMATTELEQLRVELAELKRRVKNTVDFLEASHVPDRPIEQSICYEDIRYTIDILLGTVTGGTET
jgi:chromosome segregation ATPase